MLTRSKTQLSKTSSLRGKLLRALPAVVFTAASAALFAGCVASSVNETVTGYIQSSKLDDDDNPIDVYLFDGKTEYLITKNPKHNELLDLVDRKVSVKGEVSDAPEGKKRIDVESFKVVD